MDNIFLKEITEGYLVDRNLSDSKRNEIFNYLVNTRNFIRETETEIYEEIQYGMSRLSQQKLFSSILDEIYLEESLLLIGAIGAGLITLYKLFDGFDHVLAKLFASTQKIHDSIRDDLKNSDLNQFSKSQSNRYKIVSKLLDSNFSNCSSMCGVNDLNKISKEEITNYMRVMFEPEKDYKWVGPKHAKNANCLISCYLDYISGSIAELNLLYKQCLQKTGEPISQFDNELTHKIMPLGNKCEQLRKDLNDLRKEFDDFLKHLYKNNPRVYSFWVDVLNTKISDAGANKKVTNYTPKYLSLDSPIGA